jgi:hypothetical protein
MKDTEKLRAYAARLKEAQTYNTEIGYSDIAVDALLDCCETLANLLDQIDRANEFMKEKGLIK